MIIEYCYYDTASKDLELVENINKAIKYNISSLSVLPSQIKPIRSILPDNIKLSTPIDYPFGILDTQSRMSIVEYAIKNGAQIIDVVCPTYYLCNRKYEKFREDIKNIQSLCSESTEVRYILEYRQFTYELLYKIAQILFDFNIKTIYPASGYSLDDISDNILAAALINKRVPQINIISNGNLWNDSHIKLVKNSILYGLRVNSLNALELLSKENILEN
jgi:deoxyribose-phosphate aldolase